MPKAKLFIDGNEIKCDFYSELFDQGRRAMMRAGDIVRLDGERLTIGCVLAGAIPIYYACGDELILFEEWECTRIVPAGKFKSVKVLQAIANAPDERGEIAKRQLAWLSMEVIEYVPSTVQYREGGEWKR